MSKRTISNWPSAYMSHYCTLARRKLAGACQRSVNQSNVYVSSQPQVSLAELQRVQVSLYLPSIISLTLLQRDVRFGAHCVTDYFSTDFQTLFSLSDSLCLHAFVFFKTYVTYTIHTLAKSSNLGWWVTVLQKMGTNGKSKSKAKQKSILLGSSLFYTVS